MLTRLGDTLGTWTPRRSSGEPLAVIRAGWTTLVGSDVARAAQPVALAGEALVVLTSSSAWSHQLAFLEPQIVRGVCELAPAAGVARLRFRVGTIRTKSGAGRAPAAPTVRRRPGEPSGRAAPASPQEALARYRAVVERSRAAHVARGGGFVRRATRR